jgi:sentrin-specific protease 1
MVGDRKARVAHRGARRDDRRCEADPNAKACYFLNSFFFAKLMGDDARSYSYRGVQRWTKTNGVDLFAKRFILAPINVGNMRWCLAAVDMHLKTVRYYDSMAGPGWVYLRALLRYLGDEHQDKKGVRFDAAGWTMVATTRNTPQQLNGFDCGVFASYCAHYISLGVRPAFSQADMPHLRRRMMADILAKKIHAS